MSRDIRSFFLPKKIKPEKPKLDDDEDVIPESPDVHIKNKKKSRKKRVLSDDSDEEIFSKKRKPDKETKSNSKNKKVSDKPELKEVKAVDIFGKTPVKRTEPIVTKTENKKKTETGIHSDDEFDKSLLELDAVEETITKEDLNKNKSSTKVNGNESKYFSTEKPPKEENTTSNTEIKSEKKENVSSKSKTPEKSTKDNTVKRKRDDDSTKEAEDKSLLAKKKKITENRNNKTKPDFSEFLDDSSTVEVSSDDVEEKNKKKKHNKSLNESVLTDEERHERRRHSAALYQQYLNRSGPKHLGAKEIPEGAANCLKDCAFLLTGVLDSFEREEIVEAIQKYGGCIKGGISKKVTHVLAGNDAGPAKMAKAEELGIKIINEDDFIQMIKDSNNKSSSNKVEIKKEVKKEKSFSKEVKKDKSPKQKSSKDDKTEKKLENTSKSSSKTEIKSEESIKIKSESKESKSKHKESKLDKKESKHKIKDENVEKSTEKDNSSKLNLTKSKSDIKPVKKETTPIDIPTKSSSEGMKNYENKEVDTTAIMWVEKYKPQNVKQIIGQHGDASNVKKLTNWLTKWYANRKAKLPKPSPWAKNDDGGYYKAALLSGPPGVGKTTTVALVCKELGFDTVEFNASDTRNKTLIKEQISDMLTTTSLSAYSKGDTGKQAVTKKHVLVMDEVDGMAGNEDRGGLQELINLIKLTSVPIICMCNDRNSQKMRSLVNYCYDLRFSKPRVDQIKSAMLSICFKEGIKIPQDALTQLIVAANQDVRQTLNLLSMWAVDPNANDPEKLKRDTNKVIKDIKLGPWEAVRKVFTQEEHKTMSINDKSDLFFFDYSLAPLFVQENYLNVAPHCPKNEVLDRISKAADSISAGDLVDARIRRNQAWGLLPTQAMYASVIPGHFMSGHVTAQINFPGWLGKNSRRTKMHRLCQEIHAHTRLSTSGSKSSIFLDYSSHLRDAILNPLLKEKNEGISQSMEVLESYHMLREDLDSLVELAMWPGQRNPMVLIDSKVKAAMTRTYNKTATALPYAPGNIKKTRARDAEEEDLGEEDLEEEDEEDNDPEHDALIKKKKTKDSDKPSSSKAGSSKTNTDANKGKTTAKDKGKKKK